MSSHGAAGGATRVYGGRPAEVRQQERRQKLIAAGHELFGTVGFSGTSVRSVLAEAQLSERYFGESFKSLQDLLLAVYDEAVGRVLLRTMTAVQEVSGDINRELEVGLRAFFEAITDDPRDARVILLEHLTVGPSGIEMGATKLNLFSMFVAERARALSLQTGPYDVSVLASAAVGSCLELARRTAFGALDRDAAIEHVVFIFTATLKVLAEQNSPVR